MSCALAALLTLPLLLASTALWAQAGAPDAGGPLPAEQQPLAAQSMLLDVVRQPDGGFVAVGERGHVILSNSGTEWDQADFVPSRATLTAVAAAGNLLWAGGHDTTILHSEDGGRTWSLQYVDPERQQPIMDIYFFDEQRGFAIGAYGLMLRTDDGGASWEDHIVSEDEWHLNSLVNLGEGSLVIAGEAGYSYYSRDGGETWSIVEMPYPGSMFGALNVGPCILAFGLRGNVQQSCDQGETWEELATPTQASLAGAAHANGVTVMVGNSGQVLLRYEDGRFDSMQHPSGVDFAAARPLDDGRWLLFGNEGVHALDLADKG